MDRATQTVAMDSFGGIRRLYGDAAWAGIQAARVLVLGLGGVGGWAAEALARTGIGSLVLVDGDDFCVTNINRQLHAIAPTVGLSKAEVVAERCRSIHPAGSFEARPRYVGNADLPTLLEEQWDVVIDAVDSVMLKTALIAACRQRGLPIVVSGGAGGRSDPAAIKREDLSRVSHDALLRMVRKRLRREHGFPRDPRRKWGCLCIYSDEPQRYPRSDGSVCLQREKGESLRLDCQSGFGTVSFVTGTFGLYCAQAAIDVITREADSVLKWQPASMA